MTRLNIREWVSEHWFMTGQANRGGRNEATGPHGKLLVGLFRILEISSLKKKSSMGLNRDDCKGCNLVLAKS